jgi:hypothetical protein
MDDNALIPVFIPALIVLLRQDERAKGSPLTAEEVTAIRDRALCVRLPRDLARQILSERGFADIDPLDTWEEWKAYRARNAAIGALPTNN